jgi:hypothetical protein
MALLLILGALREIIALLVAFCERNSVREAFLGADGGLSKIIDGRTEKKYKYLLTRN